MRTLVAGVSPWLMVLALCAHAPAQDSNKDRDNKGKANADQAQTIRGVIAGVTVEGELSVDYRNRRAVETEMTLLTIVGSPRHDDAQNDAKAGDNREGRRHNRNVYILAVSPRTKVRDASRENAKDRNEEKGQPSSIDALEIGDRVEAKFTPREDDKSSSGADANRRVKHGRHRIFAGEAISLTILAEPNREGESSDRAQDNK